MKRLWPSMVSVLAVLSCVPTAAFAVFAVPGTSDPWLAGMPNGSTASINDSAPGQSPVLVPGLTLPASGYLTFSASGTVANGPAQTLVGPDGERLSPT